MTARASLLLAILSAACGSPHAPARPEPSPLVGTWADELHTARFRPDHEAELETRTQCARLPCAAGSTSFGTWPDIGDPVRIGSGDAALDYAIRLEFDQEGALLFMTPPGGDPLRLRRQPALALAGTAWDAPDRTLVFTADGFERTAPCPDSCAEPVVHDAGTWSFADGELAIEYDGANESFAVLIESQGDELVLVGPTETVHYHRRR